MRPAVGRNSRFAASAWIPLLLLLAAGCGKEPPPAPPDPAPVQDPEPELPALGEVTVPKGEIDAVPFTVLDPPATKPAFRWNFETGKQYVYAFTQTITQVTANVRGGEKKVIRTRDRNGGTFEFTAQKDGHARALMRIVPRESVVDGKPLPKEVVGARKPRVYDCTMRADGTAAVIRGKDPQVQEQAQSFFLVLLPIQPGEKAGSAARFKTRLDGWRKVRRWECARLVTEFELNPESASGKSLARGRTVAYFSPRDGCIVQAETVVAQATRVKTKDAEGRWITSAYDSVTVSRLKLKE